MTKAERIVALTEEITKEIIAEKNAQIAALEAQLARRDERIRKLREALDHYDHYIYFDVTMDGVTQHLGPKVARNALAADAKEGESPCK